VPNYPADALSFHPPHSFLPPTPQQLYFGPLGAPSIPEAPSPGLWRLHTPLPPSPFLSLFPSVAYFKVFYFS